MKKWMLYFLCVIVLLTGCTGQHQEAVPTAPEMHLVDTDAFSYYVNISADSVWDLCPFMDTQLNYMLITKEPLDPAETVMLMFTNTCEYTSTECTEEWMTEFPFWLYQTYRGVDWNEVAVLAEAAQAGDAAAKEKVAEYETLYLADYNALSPEDIPQMYGYWITNNVTTADHNAGWTAAQYEQIPLTIGREELTVDVGLLNICNKGLDQYLASDEVDEDLYMGRLADARPSYWGDGTVTLAPMLIAEEDYPQILTNLELYGIKGQIMDIQVNFDGNVQHWDGVSEIEIPAGTPASITVTLQTQANEIIGYCEDANLMVQREMNSITQRLWYFASISQSWNIYELYAMMVDGQDISSYYAYTAQWKQPEHTQAPRCTRIEFAPVTVTETDACRMYVTGASWDEHAYTLYISAANQTEQRLELNLGDVYFNNRAYERDFTVHLYPRQSNDFTWRIAWESMAEYGIAAQTGEEIRTIEFIFNPLYDGMIPTDENGHLMLNEAYTRINPMGADTVQDTSIQGSVVLETDVIRLCAVGFERNQYSCLTSISRPLAWNFSFAMENLSDDTISYMASDFCLDDIPVDGIDAGTFRAGSGKFNTVPLYLTEANLSQIEEPQTLTFTLTLNSTDVYTVAIDLSQELEG